MGNRPKEFDLNLVQRDPSREVLLGKMRSKLATFTPPPAPASRPRMAASRGTVAKWATRVAMVGAIAACNWLAYDQKDAIVRKMAKKAVPSLVGPSPTLSSDEQALYWTWALYDIAKFRAAYPVAGHPAIDGAVARQRIEQLIPEVSTATLGEISHYMPVAFQSVSSGGRP